MKISIIYESVYAPIAVLVDQKLKADNEHYINQKVSICAHSSAGRAAPS